MIQKVLIVERSTAVTLVAGELTIRVHGAFLRAIKPNLHGCGPILRRYQHRAFA
jgi:hypothetical protein